MDITQLEVDDLYFEKPLPPHTAALLEQAATAYGEGGAEDYLLRAFSQAPRHLTVLVALYRYYYYQHRLPEALQVANLALEVAGEGLLLEGGWEALDAPKLARSLAHSVALTRFYLLALKGAGYLNLRLYRLTLARRQLGKVVALDGADQLGAKALLALAVEMAGEEHPAAMELAG